MIEGQPKYIHYSISGWHNHCALASLSHFLQEALFRGNLSQANHVFQSTRMMKLLEAFRECYSVDNMTWQDVKELLERYPHPYDQQAIWSLPLRRVLASTLKRTRNYKTELYQQFLAVADIIFENSKRSEANFQAVPNDYSSLYHSNLQFFWHLKELLMHNINRYDTVLDLESHLLLPYWNNMGFNKYCDYVGGLQRVLEDSEGNVTMNGDISQTMITADELSKLCQYLKINLTVFGPNANNGGVDFERPIETTRGYSRRDKIGDLIVGNYGLHWERCIRTDELSAVMKSSRMRHYNQYKRALQHFIPLIINQDRETEVK